MLDGEHREDDSPLPAREVPLAQHAPAGLDRELPGDVDPHGRSIAREMELIVECDCGWTCRGPEEDVVAACTAHGRDVHGLELSREQVLAVARPADETPTEIQ